MSDFVFYVLIGLRIILPPLIALTCHPLLSILLIELVVDGLISPHHVAGYTPYKRPLSKKNVHKSEYDKPLDFWGQLWAMYPVWFSSSKYYNVFNPSGLRILVTVLFLVRIVGYIGYGITYSRKKPNRHENLFIMFPNVFLLVYIVIAMMSVLAIQNVSVVYFLFPFLMLMAILKERQLHTPKFKKKWGRFASAWQRPPGTPKGSPRSGSGAESGEL